MAIGALNNLSALYAENNLNQTDANLQTTLQQISSGSAINSGADDPAGISMVDEMQAGVSSLAQQQTNAAESAGQLQVASGALSQVNSLLDRATTLATEASNGVLNPAQDAAANLEYQSLISEFGNINSTTTYNGSPVFSGGGGGTAAGIAGALATTSLAATSLTGQAGAENAAGAVNGAVSGVAQLAGSYGAEINADNASAAVAQTQETNTEAALNSIQATDYAQATTNLSQQQTLEAAGIFAEQQANNAQQNETDALFGQYGAQQAESTFSVFA